MPYDPDGFIRDANLFFNGNPQLQSFPLMIAEQYSGQSIKALGHNRVSFLGQEIPYSDPELDTFRIGVWSRDPATRIPAWKLLDGLVPVSALTDKLVLIGQTHNASSDTHLTPLFRTAGKEGVRLKLGGTAILASAIRTLLEHREVRRCPAPWITLSVALGALAAAALLLSGDLTLGISGLITMMAVVLGVSLLLYAKARFWLPFLPMETGLALMLPLTLGLRFFEEQLTSREAAAAARTADGSVLQLCRPCGGGDHLATSFRAFTGR